MSRLERGRSGWHARRWLGVTLLLTALAAFATSALAVAGADNSDKPGKPAKTPNILFFIMDDVGIDQMKTFGYGGATPPRTPTIDTIAQGGVRFRNTWAMPECSPSRSAVFTGRWPLRTNIQAVISSTTLANSQVSPFEVTVPKLLRNEAGYESAMFGKFHLGGPQRENNPYGNGAPHAIGWDFFYGWIEGEPYPIDTSAGTAPPDGATGPGPYACGYVPGANPGVCRFADGSCEDTAGLRPGLACIARGGLVDEGGRCGTRPSHSLNFDIANAYYVSPLVINHPDGKVDEVPLSDPRARGYRTTLEVDAARKWIRQRNPKTPWMATVSFSSAHVPFQPAPPAFGLPGTPSTSGPDCTSPPALRVLSNQTIEAMDTEMGRLLVELGLASRNRSGDLVYDPKATDTMIVILGDNGTYAPVVKAPFDPLHSKGTPYQTGVWVPLIVAGPLVRKPDREVTHMVNVADLFALFGEIAGVDVRRAVPSSHALDAVSMLPYLSHPAQKSLRSTNFTQGGMSITAGNVQSPPCVIPVEGAPVCVQLFPTQDICGSEGGSWFGGPPPAPDYASCCDVKNTPQYVDDDTFKILPGASWAIRNDRFKLLQKEVADCSMPPDYPISTVTEFYAVDEAPGFPRIERVEGGTLPPNNLLPNGTTPPMLPPAQRKNFYALQSELQTVLNSEIPCPGDGNLDKVVNGKDLANWLYFRTISRGQSSWYDFPNAQGIYDGLTDKDDLKIIQQNLGTDCLKGK